MFDRGIWVFIKWVMSTIFNNIQIKRKDSNGNVVQSIRVPLAYAPKEKFIARLNQGGSISDETDVQITLPRIGFEMATMSYDSTRKLNLLNKYTQEDELFSFLDACKKGKNIGLLSEAGCPGIADPGAEIAKIAHRNNIQVVPLVGPSSIILALMASGMNGQSFAFNGYLPIDKGERKSELKRLEKLSQDQNQTQLFIETPYRNNKMLEDLCAVLHPATRVCVACDITLSTEYIKTMPANEWKNATVDLHKRPAIFIIHKD